MERKSTSSLLGRQGGSIDSRLFPQDVVDILEGLLKHENALSASSRPLGALSAVPDGDNPCGAVQRTIEESIGFDDDLAVREIGKLWNPSAGVGKPFEAPENLLGAASQAQGRVGIVGAN